MIKIKRWIAGLAAAALLLAADAALTWHLARVRFAPRAGSAEVYSEAEQDPLNRFRLEREQLRAREEAQLNEIIHSQSSDAQIVSQAQSRLMELMECARQENVVESILQGRGFQDALASVSRESANIMVRGEALTASQTAVILDLVMRETGLTGGNVKIIPIK